ncbi:OsmC family protein [Ferrigenium sp. UT5]|uniref:OsmC family protein n=1 Tax=Ferrigenium sp. UT5 TaxID=3242105 RepID=UPI00354BDAEE
MSETQTFSLTLEQQQDYAFLVRFDETMPELLTDEPPPLGQGAGPNPSRLLAASIANCLMASLLFALRKFKNEPGRLTAKVTGHYARNAAGRLRVGGVAVEIQFAARAETLTHLQRTLEQFEEFCVVTQSVRSGFPVAVTIRDGAGQVLKQETPPAS